MDVHIAQMAVHLDIQHNNRIAILRNIVLIGFQNRFLNPVGADHPAVDEDGHIIAAGAGLRRQRHQTADRVIEVLSFHLDALTGQIAAVNDRHNFQQTAVAGAAEHFLAVVDKPKRDVRIAQRKLLDDVENQRGFIRNRLEMLQPGRCFLKQAADRDLRSLIAGVRPRGLALAVADFHTRGIFAVVGQKCQIGDGSDRRQRFTAETQRVNRPQIFRRLDFTGGMPFKAQTCVFPIHPDAVVDHFHQLGAALVDVDFNPGRLRVQRVFNQFFDDAHRPFDDLPGGDHVG